jgi:hypothetical protein
MASEKPQADPFLSAIEAKIAAWTAVAESYRLAVSLDGQLGDVTLAGAAVTTPVGRAQASFDLPVGVFRDKSLKEAIPVYLGAIRRKQTNKEIAEALQGGGFPTTSDHFESTVATALYRLKNDGVLLRFSDGWDLASSYPDSLRGRLEKEAKPRAAKAKKRRRKPAAGDTKRAGVAATAHSDGKAVG